VEMRKKVRRILFGVVVIPMLLALAPVTAFGAEGAAGNHEMYTWVVGFTSGVDVARASDGSTVTMSGRGPMQAGPGHSAGGGGTYTVRNAAGTVVKTGPFMATDTLSFVSYGATTAGPPVPANATGGEGKLSVTLVGFDSGVLTIFCDAPGSNPPEGKEMAEGINLVLGKGGEFLTQTFGNTVFLDIS
jgi:hypothetical protein